MTVDPRDQPTHETPVAGGGIDVASRDMAPQEDVPTRFKKLTETWREETGGLSSPSQIASHPAYQQIISMGRPVLPLILADLEARGGQWYLALRAITGASPVPPEASGRARLVRDAWLQWGRDHGYVR